METDRNLLPKDLIESYISQLKSINMESFEEILKELQELKLTQNSYEWQEDLPEEIWKKYFKGKEDPIAYGLNVDTHKWYECSTRVYEFDGRYLGVNSITNMFSESSSPDDIGMTIEFFEMEETKTVTYEKK